MPSSSSGRSRSDFHPTQHRLCYDADRTLSRGGTTHRPRVALAGGIILASCLQAMDGSSLLAQVAVPQTGRSDQMRDRRVTVISADDGSVLNHAVPRPDLVPRRMCRLAPAPGRTAPARKTSAWARRFLAAGREATSWRFPTSARASVAASE